MPSTARCLPLSVALALAGACVPAHATEGGLGRPITGLQGTSYAGVVPPTPGFNLAIQYAYSSTVAYTQLGQGGTPEFTTVAAVDFYTENEATDYQNGAVFRADALLIKRTPNWKTTPDRPRIA
jgi:hypothetical protein